MKGLLGTHTVADLRDFHGFPDSRPFDDDATERAVTFETYSAGRDSMEWIYNY
jgi:hypothetical protein